MKLLVIAAALATSIGACAANADTINFGQFSGSLPNTITGTTTGGVGITITGPGSGFQELTQDSTWLGNFPDNTNVLYDNGVPGATTIDFASVLTSLSQVGVEANLYGPYTATLTAYLDGLAVGTQQFSSSSANLPNTVPSFNISGFSFDSVVISTTDDGDGYALGGSGGTGGYAGAVPEPVTWAMMIGGFGLVGGMIRRAHRKSEESFTRKVRSLATA